MEFGFFPASFAIHPGTVQTPAGEQQVMRVQIQDIGGTVVTITFGVQDFAAFAKVCADPAAAAARARIAVPRMVPPTNRKH